MTQAPPGARAGTNLGRTHLLERAAPSLGLLLAGPGFVLALLATGSAELAVMGAAAMAVAPFVVARPVFALGLLVAVESSQIGEGLPQAGPLSVTVLAQGIALCALLLAVHDRRARLAWSPVFLFALVFLATQALSALDSSDSGLVLSHVADVARDLVTLVLVTWLCVATGRFRFAVCVAVASVAALAGLTIVQEYALRNATTFGNLARLGLAGAGTTTARHAGPLEDPNFWGRLLTLYTPLALSLWISGRTLRRWVWFGAFVTLLLGGFLTQSRGAMIALGAAMVAWLLLAGRKYARMLLLAPVVVALLLVNPITGPRLSSLTEVRTASTGEGDESLAGRATTQETGLAIFSAHPLFGTGVGTYEDEAPEFQRRLGIVKSDVLAPHNVFLQMAAETGIVGLCAWLLFLASAALALARARLLLRRIPGPRGQSPGSWLALGALAGLVGWMVASGFLHLAQFRALLVLLGIGAAIDIVSRSAPLRAQVPLDDAPSTPSRTLAPPDPGADLLVVVPMSTVGEGPSMPVPEIQAAPGSGGDLEGRAVKGFAWASLSSIGAKLIVFVMTLVLARLLVPADFGVVAAALTVITYLDLGLDLGVGAALVYEQEKGVTHRARVAFSLNLVMTVGAAAVFFLAAPTLAEFFRVGGDADVFRALALFVLLRGGGQVHEAVLRRDLRFREITAVEVTRAVTRAAVTIALAGAGFGVWSLAVGLLASELLAMLRLWSIVHLIPAPRIDRSVAKALLGYGLSILVVQIVSEVGVNSDYLVVGHMLGPVQLGFYVIAFRLPELAIMNTLNVFSNVAFPAFSRARAEGRDSLRTPMLKTLSIVTLFGLALGVGLAIASRDAVSVLFGSKWAPSAAPFAMIALALGLESVGYAAGDLLKATGRLRTLLIIIGSTSALQVIGFLVVAREGITAVAAVHLVAAALLASMWLVVLARLVDASVRDVFDALRPALATATGIAICALPLRLVLPTGLLSLVAITIAGTVGGVVGLRLGGREMVVEIGRLARRVRS